MRGILPDLSRYLDASSVLTFDAHLDKHSALDRLVDRICIDPAISDPAIFRKAIHDREDVNSTGMGAGVAIPHARLPSIRSFVIVIGRFPLGLAFDAKDGALVHLAVMIAAPEHERPAHLKVLAAVATRLNNPEVVSAMLAAPDGDGVIRHFIA